METVPFLTAVHSQPVQLERARTAFLGDLGAARLRPWLPKETIAIVAMGASHNAGHALVAVLAAIGIRAVNLTASDVLNGAPGFQPADHYLIVSESGRSPEPLEAARRLAPAERIGITNVRGSQLSETVDTILTLGGVPDSAVYTVGYTATLLSFALLLDHLGLTSTPDAMARVPATVAGALQSLTPSANAIAEVIAGAGSVDVIGQGASYASAAEFALMCREGIHLPATAYNTLDYLHGPIEAASPACAVVAFGAGRERTIPESIPGALLEAGVPVILVTSGAAGSGAERSGSVSSGAVSSGAGSAVAGHGHPLLTVVDLPEESDAFVRTIVETVLCQLVLARAAELRSQTIGDFSFKGLGTKLPPADA
ncbi:SIS domain-containing protein [Rathayibacter soli]|uniref:SIS domain-containing protein n=1 Tax=Rathayibacter soli TaxID=3144168 RepID=UPI0027E4A654|nr:SIS domain-containing protein [Glaciibacter superstes]